MTRHSFLTHSPSSLDCHLWVCGEEGRGSIQEKFPDVVRFIENSPQNWRIIESLSGMSSP
jgi:hypothetical protein